MIILLLVQLGVASKALQLYRNKLFERNKRSVQDFSVQSWMLKGFTFSLALSGVTNIVTGPLVPLFKGWIQQNCAWAVAVVLLCKVFLSFLCQGAAQGFLSFGIARSLPYMFTFPNSTSKKKSKLNDDEVYRQFQATMARQISRKIWKVVIVGQCFFGGLLCTLVAFIIDLIMGLQNHSSDLGRFIMINFVSLGSMALVVSLLLCFLETKYQTSSCDAMDLEMNSFQSNSISALNNTPAQQSMPKPLSLLSLTQRLLKTTFSRINFNLFFLLFSTGLCFGLTSAWLPAVGAEMVHYSLGSSQVFSFFFYILGTLLAFMFIRFLTYSARQIDEKEEEDESPGKKQRPIPSRMFVQILFMELFVVIGLLAIFFGAFVIPNGGNFVFSSFGLVVCGILGSYPLVCMLSSWMLGHHLESSFDLWIDQKKHTQSIPADDRLSVKSMSTRASTSRAQTSKSFANQQAYTFLDEITSSTMALVLTIFTSLSVSLVMVPFLMALSRYATLGLHYRDMWDVGIEDRGDQWRYYLVPPIPGQQSDTSTIVDRTNQVQTKGNDALAILLMCILNVINFFIVALTERWMRRSRQLALFKADTQRRREQHEQQERDRLSDMFKEPTTLH